MSGAGPALRGVVDLELIAEQWDQLVRIVASLKDRTAPADVVLQRLINAAPADRLGKALTALGSLVKTIHILRYIHEELLRQAIQLQLNRGEFRHIIAKWLFFANQGDFRVGDYEEVMNKASCLSLLSNAVLVWNTVHIARIVAQLPRRRPRGQGRGPGAGLAAAARPHRAEWQLLQVAAAAERPRAGTGHGVSAGLSPDVLTRPPTLCAIRYRAFSHAWAFRPKLLRHRSSPSDPWAFPITEYLARTGTVDQRDGTAVSRLDAVWH